MNTPVIRSLLIDDEILSRLALRQALASHPEVEIVGECANAAEALKAIDVSSPELLFLDIRMPGMDGFKLLHSLSLDTLPLVVFITAYSRHALRAFDTGATDYLLKPIDQERFDQTMERVKQHWQGLSVRSDGGNSITASNTKNRFVQRLSVHVDEHERIVPVSDIDWIQADGNYVHLHVGNRDYLHRQSLRGILESVDPTRFLRIHRSTAVNVERIHEIHPLFNGNAEAVLRDGTRLPMSRRFRRHADRILGTQ